MMVLGCQQSNQDLIKTFILSSVFIRSISTDELSCLNYVNLNVWDSQREKGPQTIE